jgi:surface protein
MQEMFMRSQFNGDISNWDVSKVKSMGWMFHDSQFTGNISNWDVSKVTDMEYMLDESPYASVDTLTEIINTKSIDCRQFHPKILEALPEDCRSCIKEVAELQESVGVVHWKEAMAVKDTLNTKKRAMKI